MLRVGVGVATAMARIDNVNVGGFPDRSSERTDKTVPALLALAFGVLFALFVTLLMVPALYCIGDDLKRRRAAVQLRMARLLTAGT